MKLLVHAINGVGLGHVVRTRRIADSLKELQPKADIVFATNTKYGAILEQHYKTYTLKRDTRAVLEGRYSYEEYLEYNTMAISKIIIHERPDAVLFDCELNRDLDLLCRKLAIQTAYVLRIPTADRFEAIKDDLRLFNAIIVPHEESEFPSEQKEFLLKIGASFVGPILDCRESVQNLSRDGILIAFGSGAGIPDNEPLFSAVDSFLQSLRENHGEINGQNANIDIVTGPFYEGSCNLDGFHSRLTTESLVRDMYRARVVISGAGYNTINEILSTRTPAVVVPLKRRWDDQFLRAENYEKLGCIKVARTGILRPVCDILNHWQTYQDKFPAIQCGNRQTAEILSRVLG